MKIKILLVLIMSVLFLQSCAPTGVKIASVVSPDQKIFSDGTVTSEKKHVVSLSHYTEIDFVKDKTIFMIIVENRGEKPIIISNDNISVIFEGNSNDWPSKRIKIQSLNDFMKDLENDYYNEEYRITNDIIRRVEIAADNIRWSAFEITKKAIAVAFEIKLDNLVNDIELMRIQFEQLEDLGPEFIIEQRTIMPDDFISGIFVCDTRDIDPEIEGHFKIVVSIDGEGHEFTFARSL